MQAIAVKKKKLRQWISFTACRIKVKRQPLFRSFSLRPLCLSSSTRAPSWKLKGFTFYFRTVRKSKRSLKQLISSLISTYFPTRFYEFRVEFCYENRISNTPTFLKQRRHTSCCLVTHVRIIALLRNPMNESQSPHSSYVDTAGMARRWQPASRKAPAIYTNFFTRAKKGDNKTCFCGRTVSRICFSEHPGWVGSRSPPRRHPCNKVFVWI